MSLLLYTDFDMDTLPIKHQEAEGHWPILINDAMKNGELTKNLETFCQEKFLCLAASSFKHCAFFLPDQHKASKVVGGKLG